jgi:toxin ParE1/3/4
VSAKPVVPRVLAISDVEAALDHYLSEAGSNVADGMVDALDKAFAHIGRQPGTGSPRYAHELNLPGLRSWPLTRYPYLVFYIERDDHIDVWRELHAKRDIPAWLAGEESRKP